MVPVLKGFKKGLFSPKGTVRVKGVGKGGGVGANQVLHCCHGLTAKSGPRLAPLAGFYSYLSRGLKQDLVICHFGGWIQSLLRLKGERKRLGYATGERINFYPATEEETGDIIPPLKEKG